MLEIVRELVDAVHSLRAITDNRRAELHARLDEAAGIVADDTQEQPPPAA